MVDNAVMVSETGNGKLAESIAVRQHRFAADEPVAHGGTDTGPSPYDLLLAALGSCTAMTLRLYADRKGWPVQRISVRLNHDKVHAEDSAEAGAQHAMLDRIERVIILEGPLDAAQRQRLLEIADHCPVHRTLQSKILIRSQIAA